MFDVIWITLVAIISITGAWLSVKLNHSNTWELIIPMYLLQLIPMWIIISKYSKQIFRDAVIYDVLICVCYLFTMIALGESKGLNTTQSIGVAFMIIGFLLVKVI